ncbi:unnamed protein product [Symbiodinium sp. CCMP2592]|nr:unnamed protein product [Symbiodinium sp. CCMP2592]
MPVEHDADDLALPGEALEDDENLRLEINIDRETWNRHITTNHGFNIQYTVLKNRYQKKCKSCLPFRAQSEFAECNQCFDLKQEIKAEKDVSKKFGLIRDYKEHLRAVGFDRELEQHLEGLDPRNSDAPILLLQFDEMDQAKWSLPRYPENRGSKTLQQYVRPRLKVVGVWASKYLLTLYLVDAIIAHDASLTVEAASLVDNLKVRKALPPTPITK